MANEFLTRSEELVDETHRLGAVVSRSVRSVVYETDPVEGAVPAVIRIRELDPPEVVQQAERWKEAVKFTHPNLLRIYDAGACLLNGTSIAYATMERAEESLAGVLAERALSDEETTEMLGPTLSALAYLHKNGYAHGSLRPSNVMAAGDKLKLSSDSAVRTADGGSATEDMQAIGYLIVESLTRKRLSGPDFTAEKLSPLFRDIVTHCLEADPEKRWTVQEIEKRLYAPASRVESKPVEPPPVRVDTSAPPKISGDVRGIPKRAVPVWIYAGLAALVVIVILVAGVTRLGNSSGKSNVSVAPPTPTVAPEVARPEVAKEDTAPLPRVISRPEPVRNAAPRATGRKADGWSVIVAAYGSHEAAEKRMHATALKWPKFNVRVQEQKADRARYLVVLGQNLSEADAQALRNRALGSGLPHDTYIKRLM